MTRFVTIATLLMLITSICNGQTGDFDFVVIPHGQSASDYIGGVTPGDLNSVSNSLKSYTDSATNTCVTTNGIGATGYFAMTNNAGVLVWTNITPGAGGGGLTNNITELFEANMNGNSQTFNVGVWTKFNYTNIVYHDGNYVATNASYTAKKNGWYVFVCSYDVQDGGSQFASPVLYRNGSEVLRGAFGEAYKSVAYSLHQGGYQTFYQYASSNDSFSIYMNQYNAAAYISGTTNQTKWLGFYLCN